MRISRDDFGTGYSSLANVQSFSFDKIKIDRMFISGGTHQAGGLAVLKAIVVPSLGVMTVAEGIDAGRARSGPRRGLQRGARLPVQPRASGSGNKAVIRAHVDARKRRVTLPKALR